MLNHTNPAAIAVVGMACWYPGARSPRELWENILAGRQEFRRFLECRMPTADYHDADPEVPDRTYGQQGAFLDGFVFDWVGRRVPRQTYEGTDISHWLALEVAARALADGGHPEGEGLPRERTGVLVGNSLTGEQTRANSMRLRWPFVRRVVARAAQAQGLDASATRALLDRARVDYLSHFPPTTEDTLAGALSNTIAGRISGFFDLGGGGYVVDGACASSLLAVCTAAEALEHGRVDACLAGGVDISLDPFELVGFAKARALSPTRMRVYDRRGNGFIPGEGCGFVLLKRLEDAEQRGDRIYAVIQGYGVSSDGRNAITAPKVAGQARAIRAAWARSGQPELVEGHGTGTALGDRVELEAIASSVGEGRVGVTSLKSILGHTKAAAGIGALLKAVMAANRGVLPPTVGCEDPNPVFQGPARALYPVRQGVKLGRALKVGASAMGFGGINTHVVVQGRAPAPELEPALDETALLRSRQEAELFVLGAEDPGTLRRLARALAEQAQDIAQGELADFSAHLLRTRPPAPRVRAAVLASTPEELSARLNRLAEPSPAQPALVQPTQDGPELWLGTPSGAPRVGFLFPGQGSQQVDAARTLLARNPALRAQAQALAAGCPGLWEALYPPEDPARTDAERAALERHLSATELAQPALVLVSWIWTRRLAELGLHPDAVAGHSLGELSAFGAAGGLEPEELLALAALRGRLMAAPADRPAGMLSLRADRPTAEALLAQVPGLTLANHNTPRQVVVAGEDAALSALARVAEAAGVPAKRLPVSNAFHSPRVAGAAEALRAQAALPPRPRALRAALYTAMDPEPVGPEHELRAHFAAQLVAPVDFVGLTRRIAGACGLLVEVGPGRVLSGLVGDTLGEGGLRACPVEGRAGSTTDLLALLASAWVRGVEVRWEALHRGRLIRAFVPATERVFLVNPCETGETGGGPTPRLAEPKAPKPEAPKPEAPKPEAPKPAPPKPAPAPEPPTGGDPLALLRGLVRDRTGFALESVGEDHRLQEDLNLDSIKAGEIIAAAARQLGAAERVDPAQFLRQPLRVIAEHLREIAATAPSPSAPAPDGVASPEPAAWVRSFTLGVVPAPRSAPPRLTGLRFRVLGDTSGLSGALQAAGARPGAEDPELVVAVCTAQSTAAQVAELAAVVAALGAGVRAVALVQRQDGRFGLHHPSGRTAVAAWARSLSLERPELAVSVLDISSNLNDSIIATELLHSIRLQPGFSGVGVDAEGRWALRARPLPRVLPARPSLQPGELVLVTGGARGITARCALALAQASGVRLALVGSTPRAQANDELLRNLGAFAVEGIEARYYTCDLADAAQVQALVAEVQRVQGPIAAVVHGAGRNQPRRVEQVSAAEATAELAPKLLGAEHLLHALRGRPPRLFVALTSIIGVSGMQGNAWYAFANESLDLRLGAFAEEHPGCTPLSLAYGVWDEVGMGAKLGSVATLARLGIGALGPEEGAARFVQLLSHDPGARQAIVTAQVDTLPTWPGQLAPEPGLRFVREDVHGLEGVSARARLTLHPSTDPWLLDHNFQGSLLLPTVFGLEAMAQVAALARGGALPAEVACIEDIELPAPVVVPPEGLGIELRALVDEADPDAVSCEVRSASTGYARPHFQARVRFGARPAPQPVELPALAAPHPPLEPERDLYGGLLFQGPRFQRLGSLTGLEGRALRGTLRPAPAEERRLLGCPYTRDALLQCAQLLVPQDTSLPVRISRVRFAQDPAPAQERGLCAALLSSDAVSHVGEVWALDAQGRGVEHLEGYTVRILERHPQDPDTEALARPGERDTRRLEAMAQEVCLRRGLNPPRLALAPEAVQGRRQPERRERAQALLSGTWPGLTLAWDDEGRPHLDTAGGVSVSHDDHTLLLALADDAVGCDLEPVRPRADWRGLLGPDLAGVYTQALARGADDPHRLGTRLWCAAEALRKVGVARPQLTPDEREGALQVFTHPGWEVLTWVVRLSRGPQRVLALARPRPEGAETQGAETQGAETQGAVTQAAQAKESEAPTPAPLLGSRTHGDHLETHFVVHFDEASSPSGRVPAWMLATWMGRLRELAITPFRDPIQRAFASGGHGMVTQQAEVRLEGQAGALDRVLAHTWAEDLGPGSCRLCFRFWRLGAGEPEPLGEAWQRFGWVTVHGHGVVHAAPFPSFLHDFLASMARPLSQPAPAPLPLPVGAPLVQARFDTDLVDGNAVGNIYYTSYFRWPARALHRLLHRTHPQLVHSRGQEGEAVLTRIRLDYMREAMPFDPVEAALYRGPTFAPGAPTTLALQFTRPEPQGAVRLSLGEVDLRWARHDPAGLVPLGPLPFLSSPNPAEVNP